MSNDANQYIASTSNWRKTLKQNRHRTYAVIFMFFAIYAGIGLLVDAYIYAGAYPDAPISQLFISLLTLQLFPIATLIMLIVAGVSLLVSYAMYDKLMLLGTEYHEITPDKAQNTQEQQLYNVVEEMKIASGLKYMPKVFIIDADYMNAFASGYSEKSAMVAITRGLMQKLNRDELQAVMAHELSHIRHMDIKLTLTASLLSNLSLMVLDMLFYSTYYRSSGSGNGKSRNQLAGLIMLLRFLLPVISMLLILYLSRKRELMADAGCVELMRNNEPLAKALLKISDDHVQNREAYTQQYQRTPHENVRREAYIFDPHEAGIADISSLNDVFSTHPSLNERLAALGYKLKK